MSDFWTPVESIGLLKPENADERKWRKAMRLLSRGQRLRATVYAMNTLLLHRRVYGRREFWRLFAEWARKELRKKEKKLGQRTAKR